MRLRLAHAPYIANKIAIDLANSGLVKVTKGLEALSKVCLDVIDADLELEAKVDAKVKSIVDANDDEIEFVHADRKQLFWMIKRKISAEEGLILEQEERFNSMAHKILDASWEEDLMDYDVSETRLKTIIVKSMLDFVKSQESIEKSIEEKVLHYKRPLVPGSEEYEIVMQKLYEEELKKRGML